MNRYAVVTVTALALIGAGAYATADEAVQPQSRASNKTSKQFVHKGTGVVKRVDADARTVTLAHDPIASLNWPAMTMPFAVRDSGLLWALQPGASVAFEFVQEGNRYLLTGAKRTGKSEATASAPSAGPAGGDMQGMGAMHDMHDMGDMQAMREMCMGMMGKMMSK